MSLTDLSIEYHLSQLGVSFTDPIQDYELCPEEALILLIKDYNILHHRKELSLLIGSFIEFSELYRPDLIKRLLKREEQQIVSTIGGIIQKSGVVSSRWNSLKKYINNNGLCKQYNITDRKIEKIDDHFILYRIYMPDLRVLGVGKNYPLNYMLKNNRWFWNRMRYGTSTRADVQTIFESSEPTISVYKFMKRFNVESSGLYKIFKDLKLMSELSC